MKKSQVNRWQVNYYWFLNNVFQLVKILLAEFSFSLLFSTSFESFSLELTDRLYETSLLWHFVNGKCKIKSSHEKVFFLLNIYTELCLHIWIFKIFHISYFISCSTAFSMVVRLFNRIKQYLIRENMLKQIMISKLFNCLTGHVHSITVAGWCGAVSVWCNGSVNVN